jgi:hypothetical protein
MIFTFSARPAEIANRDGCSLAAVAVGASDTHDIRMGLQGLRMGGWREGMIALSFTTSATVISGYCFLKIACSLNAIEHVWRWKGPMPLCPCHRSPVPAFHRWRDLRTLMPSVRRPHPATGQGVPSAISLILCLRASPACSAGT